MVFSSYEFIFLFLPIVLIGYFLLSKISSKTPQQLFLVSASLFFYGYFNISYLSIITISIIVNYILAKVMTNCRKDSIQGLEQKSNTIGYLRLLLMIGILFNIGMLGYFKYYDFFADNINVIFRTSLVLKNILLPLGISFFTFQQFSFLISIYKGEEKLERFIDYCLFVLFFPQLVAGPIVLYKEMMPQFTDESRRYLNYDNLSKGIYIFTMGLFKKVVIADTVALFVDNGFASSNLGFFTAWFTVLSYTLQIYFDFSGYSDMAIGLGKMFNIGIPINFMSPYKSESITEFWRRWHITLGRALSTYIYIPLGGNKKGIRRTCINLFITFLVSGLWHGAAWTFVLWGALHGACIVFERLLEKVLIKIPKVLRVTGTFFIVNLLWVLFRTIDFQETIKIFKGLVSFSNIDFMSIGVLAADGIVGMQNLIGVAYVSGLIILLYIIVFAGKNTIEKSKMFNASYATLIFTSILFVVSTLHLSRLSPFIYFNF